MAFLEREGVSLYYEEQGAGPTVILQHPLTADGRAWRRLGITGDLVARGFRCVSVDALGHGRSGPCDPPHATLRERVCDVLAVADAVGAHQFHYAGYSMGGWIGVGLIEAAPNRLRSAAIAGWDPIDGARKFTKKSTMIERDEEFLKTIDALISQRPGEGKPDPIIVRGFLATYERLFIDLPSIATLIGLSFPLMFACGLDDPYAQAAQSAAEALDVAFISLPGDHVQGFQSSGFRQGLVNWVVDSEAAQSALF